MSENTPVRERQNVPSRRQFLAAGGALAGGMLASSAGPAVAREPWRPELVADANGRLRPVRQDPEVRYDVTTFTEGSPRLAALKRGVAAMKQRQASDPTSWAYQANIHNIFCNNPPAGYDVVHYSWRFLPWHRAYLWYFEKVLQRAAGDDTLTLPYWNWTTDLALPAQYWGTGNPLYDPKRNATQSSRLDPRQTAIDGLLGLGSFAQFGGDAASAGAVEVGPHNYVHGWVGGDMGRFSTAALDPVFWAHHANVDRVWWLWNQEGNANPADSAWLDITYPFYDATTGQNVQITFAQAAALPVSYAPATEVLAVSDPQGAVPLNAPRTSAVTIPAGTAARLARAGRTGATLRVVGVNVPSQPVTVRVFANRGDQAAATTDSAFAGAFTLIPTDGGHAAHGQVNVHVVLGGGFRLALTEASEKFAAAPVSFTLVPQGEGTAQLRFDRLELHASQ